MPRGKGKANYKVGLLIEVVEQKLPQGALGWQEVAALYHVRSQENILRDHEDIKRYWAEKLCNKFKKPTGDPGDINLIVWQGLVDLAYPFYAKWVVDCCLEKECSKEYEMLFLSAQS